MLVLAFAEIAKDSYQSDVVHATLFRKDIKAFLEAFNLEIKRADAVTRRAEALEQALKERGIKIELSI